MTTPPPAPPSAPNPRVLGISGGVLFALGLMSFALVYVRHDATPDTVRLAAGVGVLLAMGYPAMLFSGAQRRMAEIEARLAKLEAPRD